LIFLLLQYMLLFVVHCVDEVVVFILYSYYYNYYYYYYFIHAVSASRIIAVKFIIITEPASLYVQ